MVFDRQTILSPSAGHNAWRREHSRTDHVVTVLTHWTRPAPNKPMTRSDHRQHQLGPLGSDTGAVHDVSGTSTNPPPFGNKLRGNCGRRNQSGEAAGAKKELKFLAAVTFFRRAPLGPGGSRGPVSRTKYLQFFLPLQTSDFSAHIPLDSLDRTRNPWKADRDPQRMAGQAPTPEIDRKEWIASFSLACPSQNCIDHNPVVPGWIPTP